MIIQLLDMELIGSDGKVVFTKESVILIQQIADRCSEIPIVQESQEQAEKYAQGLSAEQIYIDMLEKMVQAPARIHLRVAARLLIPIIDQKIRSGI